MGLSPNTIKSAVGAKQTSKRLGRGNGSQKGTYAGRGLKGQRARSGGKGGGHNRGFKQSLRKIPKLRGFKSQQKKLETVTLATLNGVTKAGDVVTPWTLAKIGVVDKPQLGVKIVASGTLDHAVTIKGCVATKTSLEAIEKAGGTLTT